MAKHRAGDRTREPTPSGVKAPVATRTRTPPGTNRASHPVDIRICLQMISPLPSSVRQPLRGALLLVELHAVQSRKASKPRRSVHPSVRPREKATAQASHPPGARLVTRPCPRGFGDTTMVLPMNPRLYFASPSRHCTALQRSRANAARQASLSLGTGPRLCSRCAAVAMAPWGVSAAGHECRHAGTTPRDFCR